MMEREVLTLPRFIYLTGCDGTGKSTQAALLMEYLRRRSIRANHLWLRFPFLLSMPLLLYARVRKFSYQEEKDGRRYGYWEFWRSRLLRWTFPWFLLLDAFLAAVWHVYLPLLTGKTIVCERFALDMLADLMVAFRDFSLPLKLPGKLFVKLIPAKAQLILLDQNQAIIVARRPELIEDRSLRIRLSAFRILARLYHIPVLVTDQTVETSHRQILVLLGAHP